MNDKVSGKRKILCPVCLVAFPPKDEVGPGDTLVCPVCGAMLEVTAVGSEVIDARRLSQPPDREIRDRTEAFARLRGFRFNEDKESIIDGLIGKHERYGDFFCPCKFDNLTENICPCLETRSGYVLKEGHCY